MLLVRIAELVAVQEEEQCMMGGVPEQQEAADAPEMLQQVLSFGGKLSTLAYRCLEVLEAEGLVKEQAGPAPELLTHGQRPSNAGNGTDEPPAGGITAEGGGAHDSRATPQDGPAPMEAETPMAVDGTEVADRGDRLGSDMLQLSARPLGGGAQGADDRAGGTADNLEDVLWQQLGAKQRAVPTAEAEQCLTPQCPAALATSYAKEAGAAAAHGTAAAAANTGGDRQRPADDAGTVPPLQLEQQVYVCTADTARLLAIDAIPALVSHLHHLQHEAAQLLDDRE
jgi:hypothetical protein